MCSKNITSGKYNMLKIILISGLLVFNSKIYYIKNNLTLIYLPSKKIIMPIVIRSFKSDSD